jgi:hypothetical protein
MPMQLREELGRFCIKEVMATLLEMQSTRILYNFFIMVIMSMPLMAW